MKYPKTLLSLLALCVLAAPITAQDKSLSGRIQHKAPPGNGAGSMTHMDHPIPADEVRVGPSAKEGIGLAYLAGIEVDDAGRNQIMMAKKIELLVNVIGVDHYNGAPPSPLNVALLSTHELNNPEWGPFGAWNNAKNLKVVGTIEADPETQVYRFDITKALQDAPLPSKDKPVIFFGIYSPVADLTTENGGKHVILGGNDEQKVRLEITE